MFYVYLLQHDKTNQLYIGYTSDLKRRVLEHNRKGSKFTTRKTGQWFLKYYEAYESEKDAKARESKLKKHGSAKQKLVSRLKESLNPWAQN